MKSAGANSEGLLPAEAGLAILLNREGTPEGVPFQNSHIEFPTDSGLLPAEAGSTTIVESQHTREGVLFPITRPRCALDS